jgi:hypothetical protein
MRWVGWSEGWVIFNRDYILGSSLSGKYPIARYLYVYLNRKPCQPAIHAGYCLRARCADDARNRSRDDHQGWHHRDSDLNKLGISPGSRR